MDSATNAVLIALLMLCCKPQNLRIKAWKADRSFMARWDS